MVQITSSTSNYQANSTLTIGYYTSIFTAAVTLITFVIAILTPPISGSFCVADCIEYPYTNIVSRFPRDYIWMYPAILLSLLFFILMICVHNYASKEKKIFGHIGVSFALMSALILVVDYFVQISVIQPSIMNGETDGISIITQYNPHGIFIALEEIGYLMMSVSFLFAGLIFSKTDRLEHKIRWIFIISFLLSVISFIIIIISYGINREYLFEITVITIDWITLILTGILLSIIFKRAVVKRT